MTPTPPTHVGFEVRQGELHCEGVAVTVLAERFGTPLYVYSRAAIERAYRDYADALAGRPSLVCYAMKAHPRHQRSVGS